MLESDPLVIARLKKRHNETQKDETLTEVAKKCRDQELTSGDLGTGVRLFKSSSSCDLRDIQHIVLGGLSSRFWLYRKHINRMDDARPFMQNCEADHPFRAWQCLTLFTEDRSIDLVIKEED